MENITQFCWKYSSSFQQWKNFENRLKFEKVIDKSLVASIFSMQQQFWLWCPPHFHLVRDYWAQVSVILHLFWHTYIRVPSKEEATKLLAITFSNVPIFKILSLLKRGWIFPTKLRNIFHHTLSTFLQYLRKVNSLNLLQNTTEKSKSVSYLTKMKRLCCHTVDWRL